MCEVLIWLFRIFFLLGEGVVVEETELLTGSKRRVEHEAKGVPWCVHACVCPCGSCVFRWACMCMHACRCWLTCPLCVPARAHECTQVCPHACCMYLHVHVLTHRCVLSLCRCVHVCACPCVHTGAWSYARGAFMRTLCAAHVHTCKCMFTCLLCAHTHSPVHV